MYTMQNADSLLKKGHYVVIKVLIAAGLVRQYFSKICNAKLIQLYGSMC